MAYFHFEQPNDGVVMEILVFDHSLPATLSDFDCGDVFDLCEYLLDLLCEQKQGIEITQNNENKKKLKI